MTSLAQVSYRFINYIYANVGKFSSLWLIMVSDFRLFVQVDAMQSNPMSMMGQGGRRYKKNRVSWKDTRFLVIMAYIPIIF